VSGHAIVIGAGQIGLRCADELLALGWSVDLLARHASADAPEAARLIVADRSDSKELAQAIGPGGDLLIDTVAFGRADADQLIEVADRFSAVAAISPASVYCDVSGRTLDEAVQTGFPIGMAGLAVGARTVAPGDQTYWTRKVAMEQRLLSGAPDKAIIVRPCAIHGPFSRHPREWWFVKRMLDKRQRIPLAYSGESRFQTTSAAAIARLIGKVFGSGLRGVFNCADQDSPTVLEIGQTIAAHLGVDPEFVPLDRSIGTVGRTPWSVPHPFTVANAGTSSFACGYADEVTVALDWLLRARPTHWREAFPTLAAYPWELFDYAAEDARLGSRA
jgi:nucleoside-diphosphate-sugar epimerase